MNPNQTTNTDHLVPHAVTFLQPESAASRAMLDSTDGAKEARTPSLGRKRCKSRINSLIICVAYMDPPWYSGLHLKRLPVQAPLAGGDVVVASQALFGYSGRAMKRQEWYP